MDIRNSHVIGIDQNLVDQLDDGAVRFTDGVGRTVIIGSIDRRCIFRFILQGIQQA